MYTSVTVCSPAGFMYSLNVDGLNYLEKVLEAKKLVVARRPKHTKCKNGKRTTVSATPNKYEKYTGREEGHDYDMFHGWDDILVDDDFGADFRRRYPIGMTSHQKHRRELRNMTTETISIGKRVPTYEEREGGYEGETYQEFTGIRCETEEKRRFHDSHGVHGRKPAYKQFATRRPKE